MSEHSSDAEFGDNLDQPPPSFDVNDVDYPFKTLSHHARDFWWPSTIARIEMPTNLVQFYREYVAQSKPCIIVGAFDKWDALRKWNIEYLREKAGKLEISADLTPSGHGDCVVPAPAYDPLQTYNTPESVPDAKLRSGDPSAENDEVYYLQHQNDSFRKEYASVLGSDLDSGVEQFGTEVFGGPPDAINFWAGDSRAVSSMHKDHYENLYCVVKGTKKFTLLPPTDLPWLGQQWFREANFERNEQGTLTPVLQQPENAIPWIPIDPDMDPALRAFLNPRASHISPLHVEVREGETLYLPALVYHKVAQEGDPSEGKVIAINYWWDMQFGTSYTYFKLLEAAISQRDTKDRQNEEEWLRTKAAPSN